MAEEQFGMWVQVGTQLVFPKQSMGNALVERGKPVAGVMTWALEHRGEEVDCSLVTSINTAGYWDADGSSICNTQWLWELHLYVKVCPNRLYDYSGVSER